MPNVITRFGIPAMLILGVIIVLFTLFSATSVSGSGSNSLKRYAKGSLANLEITQGNMLPSGVFEDANGDELTLESFKGQTLVVNLWFEACPPCEEEMPSLAALQDAVKDEGILVLAIALDREYNRESSKKSLHEWTNGRLDFYFDKSYGLAYDVGARGMPTTLIYNKSGQERARLAGGADWASKDALALIRAIDEGQ